MVLNQRVLDQNWMELDLVFSFSVDWSSKKRNKTKQTKTPESMLVVQNLDLLCLETLSVTLALSSEMLSLTSLTYDSSSEPCRGYRTEWVRAGNTSESDQNKRQTQPNAHIHKNTAVCRRLTRCRSLWQTVRLQKHFWTWKGNKAFVDTEERCLLLVAVSLAV